MGSIREIIKKNESKSYHAEVRLKGHSPERATFRTKSAAKKWIQDTESAIRDGRYRQLSESKKHTLANLIDRFIKYWLPRFPKREKKQTSLLNWWQSQLGYVVLSDLSPSLIAEKRDELFHGMTIRKKRRSPATVNRYLASLSTALGVAVKEWQWLEDNPMKRVSKLKEPQGRTRYLSYEERIRLLEACQASSNPHLFIIVNLALQTGMRRGEILNLRWEDINFATNTITLQQTKNGHRRILPLTDALKALFEKSSTFGNAGQTHIFTQINWKNKRGVVDIRSAFDVALRTAQIKDFCFHDLRHTAASHLAMNNASQSEIMAILGHKSAQMSQRYTHFQQDHLAQLIESTNKKFIKDKNHECSQSFITQD